MNARHDHESCAEVPLCGGMVGGEPWVVAALLRCLVGSLGGSSYSLRREEREESALTQ